MTLLKIRITWFHQKRKHLKGPPSLNNVKLDRVGQFDLSGHYLAIFLVWTRAQNRLINQTVRSQCELVRTMQNQKTGPLIQNPTFFRFLSFGSFLVLGFNYWAFNLGQSKNENKIKRKNSYTQLIVFGPLHGCYTPRCSVIDGPNRAHKAQHKNA